MTSLLAAKACGTETIVYTGSSFARNPLLKSIVEEYSRFRGMTPIVLDKGPFSGAVGALLFPEC